ncbi:hypothetical protein MLD38_017308 [Melastoma candidum]|uniref:Uncharacterized protein n=1 Tax=Melastoma candidum TaxID=119954 RepID=A0ACB9QTR1_9MYRT|nr:hypothetical protein MLD38_017308 [Melastoma candidum]
MRPIFLPPSRFHSLSFQISIPKLNGKAKTAIEGKLVTGLSLIYSAPSGNFPEVVELLVGSMDSELSLIEISGEDDSFLLQPIPIPSDASTSLDKNYFPCSPLQSIEGAAPSVSSGGVDKENIGVKSLQRKRKNKKGAYNLRKSLAWNRAFLTEEGVLDPVELSMISGNGCDAMSDKLAVIHEIDKELSHENAASHSGSGRLPALEPKFPRVVGTRGQSASRSSIKTSLTTAKPTRIPVPSVKRRVLAAQDVNSSRSKHGSSSSVMASSSLKRAASSNTTNIGSKDLKKVSKPRTVNPDSSLHLHSSTANTTSSFGDSKQTQHVKPDIPAGRGIRVKRPLGNAAGPQQNFTRSIPAGKPTTAKSTAQQASESMLAKPRSGLDTLNVKNMLKPIKPSSRNEVKSASTGVSLVENAEFSEVKIQHQQLQKTEPTGLRMPSPSFSFFAQPKVKASPRSIINTQSFSALPPLSSNINTPRKVGSADIMMLAPVHKMMLTPDMKSESNSMGISSNVKTSVGCIAIPRQRGDSNKICDNLKSFQQVDVGESPNHSKFSSLHKEACKDLREDINKLVSDVHKEDESMTEGRTTCHISPVIDTQTKEECITMSWKDQGAFSQPKPEDYTTSSHLPMCLSGRLYCADNDREVHQSRNISSTGDCCQTVGETQFPERHDRNASGLSSPYRSMDIVSPARWCKCEDDDPDGRLLDSEDGINRGSSNSLKVEIGMALADSHCLIHADAVSEGLSDLKDSSSNSVQPFNLVSPTEDILKESTGHIIASGMAPASTDVTVTGGINSFIVPNHMNSDEHGSLDSPWLGDDHQAASLSMASGDGVSNGKRKDEDAIPKASDAYQWKCPLLPTDGSVNSDQTTSLVQVDSSHDVGVHSDSGDMIDASSHLKSQTERGFVELDISASAENAIGDVAVAIDDSVKIESEKKIEMPGSVATYDNLSCEMNILNAPKCVTSDEHSFVSAEYKVLDCSPQLGNQQTSSPNGMLADKAANEECIIVTELNRAKDSSSLVSNVEMNDDNILVASGAASLQEPETGSASHGSANRIESPVAQDTPDDLAEFLYIDSPLQPLVGHASYQSSSPVREESPCDIVASPSISGNKIILSSNVESQSSSPPVNVEADISFASNVQHETESCTMTRDVNDSSSPPESLEKDQKQDHVVVKPPLDAVPYSDEWLAAMEAAGEDILKMKSGAVQNSPRERSEPEPSPWSPVRRKNNQAIGPFDCTKFVNPNVSTNSP